jgi:DNA-binding NtrC family response regulator
MDKADILVVDDEAVVREGCAPHSVRGPVCAMSCARGPSTLDILQEKDFNMLITNLKCLE